MIKQLYGFSIYEDLYCNGIYMCNNRGQQVIVCKDIYDMFIAYEEDILKKLDLLKDKYIRKLDLLKDIS